MDLAPFRAQAADGDLRAHVQLALRLEAQGEHYEALDWLSRAVLKGDAEACGLLGARLLIGGTAPLAPQKGLSLLDQAARGGYAPAAAQLAVLAGSGLVGWQSWSAALDYLQRAAELGDAGARRQLCLLAQAAPDAAEAQPWRRLRGRIDIAALTAAPPLHPLSESPRIGVIAGLAAPDACRWVIDQAAPRLTPAEVFDADGGTIMGETRTNHLATFGLMDTSLLNVILQARIGAGLGLALRNFEAFSVLNYRPGQEASEHWDYLDPARPAHADQIGRLGQRLVTALLYLNDDYAGGETDFPTAGLKHRGAAGDLLVFFNLGPDGRPDPRTLHAGRPPASGVKWVMSQFIRDRAFVGA